MEDIKAKIHALMSKTVAAGCTEEEAMAASKKVSELLNKYQLSLSDIRIRETKCEKGKYDVNVTQPGALHHCMSSIGYFTDCKVWFERKGGDDGRLAYKFFGLEHDVLIAEYVTKVCDWAIIYSGEDFKSDPIYCLTEKGKRAKVLADFRNAMAFRIAERLREMKDAQDRQNASDGRALVVVKAAVVTEEWAKLNIRLGAEKAKKVNYTNAAAYAAGTAAGDRVSINPGVGAQAQGRVE